MSSRTQLWVGYSRSGGRAVLDLAGPGSKALLLGSRADDLAALLALSAKDAGSHPLILDLDGSLSRRLSGYFDTYDYRSFLYDSFRLGAPEHWHAQLAASAYTVALDLTTEEEAIISHAMQVVASDGTLLSPVSVHDVMGKVEGFRGFYVDKLNGRIGSLRLFDAVDDQPVGRLALGDVIVDFHGAPYPQAAELAAALFLAKLLTLAHSTEQPDHLLLLTEAHRLFRSSPRPVHSNRLLVHLLGSSAPAAFASGQPQALNPLLLDGCPVRVYSSDAWHSQRGSTAIYPGTYFLDDRRSSARLPFIPRRVTSKTSAYAPVREAAPVSANLRRTVLEQVQLYPLSTPESVVNFLAPEFLASDVSAALASLQEQGCLLLEPKDTGSGPRVFCLTVTEKGRAFLKEPSS
jgi:hypothetical protein